MIGLPLRLLAREIYDRIVKQRGARAVALITGEEKIIPPRPHYWVCTVEAMPLSREVEFLAVDEIQLCADPERGHVFTHRLLHARGTAETMLLGAGTMAPLVRRLLPHAEIVTRERFSALTYAGPKKLTRLPRRSAIVAFSADQVYAIAELIRRQRGGAAVVMGSLSPRTRNAQVALYQNGEVDFLVATDAIGMGLNMDVDHVAFAGLRKFDGKRTALPPSRRRSARSPAARALPARRDLRVTGEAEDMDDDLISAVENHRFEPLTGAEWRNSRLDFGSLPAPAGNRWPRRRTAPAWSSRPRRWTRSPCAAWSRTPTSPTAPRAGSPSSGCGNAARRRTSASSRWTNTWGWPRSSSGTSPPAASGSPRTGSPSSSTTSTARTGRSTPWPLRLSSVRTLAYVANRPDWLADPAGWQGKMRGLEDRLSDTLHEKLMARFVDRRTSALMRGLRVREDMLAGVAADGAVTVEGHYVGKLTGVRFEAAPGRLGA